MTEEQTFEGESRKIQLGCSFQSEKQEIWYVQTQKRGILANSIRSPLTAKDLSIALTIICSKSTKHVVQVIPLLEPVQTVGFTIILEKK